MVHTVLTRLNAADGSKITDERRTKSKKSGVYLRIMRHRTRHHHRDNFNLSQQKKIPLIITDGLP